MAIQKITLPLRTRMGTIKYGVIYIPKKHRDLFPPYKENFIMQTNNGDISTWMTAKNVTFPDGCNIQGGGLLDWFRKQKLAPDDSLIIEILQPKEKYRLTIANKKNKYLEVETTFKSTYGFNIKEQPIEISIKTSFKTIPSDIENDINKLVQKWRDM